jgi:hypothetical protein
VRYNRVTRASLDALRQDAPEAVRHLESAILRSAMRRLDRVTEELVLLEDG